MWAWTPCWRCPWWSRVGADGPRGPSQPLITVILWSNWLGINRKTDRKANYEGYKAGDARLYWGWSNMCSSTGCLRWMHFILAMKQTWEQYCTQVAGKTTVKDICCSAHLLALHRKPSHNPTSYKWWPWFFKMLLDLSRWKALQVQIIQNSSASIFFVWKANPNLTFIWKTYRELKSLS